jgi:hypothetical protein
MVKISSTEIRIPGFGKSTHKSPLRDSKASLELRILLALAPFFAGEGEGVNMDIS